MYNYKKLMLLTISLSIAWIMCGTWIYFTEIKKYPYFISEKSTWLKKYFEWEKISKVVDPACQSKDNNEWKYDDDSIYIKAGKECRYLYVPTFRIDGFIEFVLPFLLLMWTLVFGLCNNLFILLARHLHALLVQPVIFGHILLCSILLLILGNNFMLWIIFIMPVGWFFIKKIVYGICNSLCKAINDAKR